ncbi:MAG: DUF4115 domain-containing protein [Defluviicoccus sp.]|nr:DUF4115 domain-containing protein [Defluviicoccus sp.]MDE0386520.1 DUF4115 domain-containing protein [Defluviicoccus sp.]
MFGDEISPGFEPAGVGASLREARIVLGRDVTHVARDLRIRQVYIEAIEAGRFEDLPGLAYQTGFLRSYANYLGLDGAELAERLRASRAGTADRGELQVFSPIDEGHLPTRSVLLLAALLAIAVYGVWYFMANTEGDPMERVAALPDRFASLLDEEPDAAGDDPPPAVPAREEPPPTPQSSARAGDTSSGIEAEATVVAIREPSAPELEPEPEPELRAAPPDGGTAAAEPDPQPISPAEPAGSGNPAAPEPAQAESETRAETATASLPSRPPPPNAEGHGGPGPAGAEAAALPVLELRALTDSWIEIRSGDAPPLYSGLLRQGQSYAVPPRQGLTLITGNAGGLEVLVDGKAMPPLGPPGEVMRNIALDGLRR